MLVSIFLDLHCPFLLDLWAPHLIVPWNHSYCPLTTLPNKHFHPFAQAFPWEELPAVVCKLTSSPCFESIMMPATHVTAIRQLAPDHDAEKRQLTLSLCFPINVHVPTDVFSFMLKLSPLLGKSIFCDLLVQQLTSQYNGGSGWEYMTTHRGWMFLGNRCTLLCRKTVCQFLCWISRPLAEEERASSGGPSDPNCCTKNPPEQMEVKAD